MTVLRHSRQHHRMTHRRWARRRKILLGYGNDSLNFGP